MDGDQISAISFSLCKGRRQKNNPQMNVKGKKMNPIYIQKLPFKTSEIQMQKVGFLFLSYPPGELVNAKVIYWENGLW